MSQETINYLSRMIDKYLTYSHPPQYIKMGKIMEEEKEVFLQNGNKEKKWNEIWNNSLNKSKFFTFIPKK